ncbi:MAG: NUDIX hydrolase [Gammaproteobacteria bacterium]|nr:NUDIX hydrolase [Gammaproteobacteria bacterium]
MKFCGECGAVLVRRVPEGDTRMRDVCVSCSAIHYENPKVVAGCLPSWEGRILLCRRAIEPRYGFWTLPAGFMENEETTSEAAARETLEEASARVDIEGLYTLFNLPHISQVYLMFRARLRDLDFGPGTESLEVALFDEREIPWDEIAFPAIRETLRLYFADRARGEFPFRSGDLVHDAVTGQYRARLLPNP